MQRFARLLLGTLGLLCPITTSALAQEGWQSDWGMGITTAWVDLGPGNQISITCTGAYGRPIAGVEFTLSGKDAPPNSLVTVSVDGSEPIQVPVNGRGRLGSDNRLEAQWFEALLETLKQGSSVYITFSDGVGARFSLVGSAEAIGLCPADFWRTDLDRR